MQMALAMQASDAFEKGKGLIVDVLKKFDGKKLKSTTKEGLEIDDEDKKMSASIRLTWCRIRSA